MSSFSSAVAMHNAWDAIGDVIDPPPSDGFSIGQSVFGPSTTVAVRSSRLAFVTPGGLAPLDEESGDLISFASPHPASLNSRTDERRGCAIRIQRWWLRTSERKRRQFFAAAEFGLMLPLT
jgi:hypothetical protein